MGRVLFNTPGPKIGSSQNLPHIHNNDEAQTNLTNRHPQIIIRHSEHALNSEHALRESQHISNAWLFSDLMKFTAVNESLSKINLNMFCFRDKVIGLICLEVFSHIIKINLLTLSAFLFVHTILI